ncbi:MAG: MarR family transcriptional regulator [Pseudomonadota bacterium]
MPRPKRLRLDDQLCFALYAATNAVTRSYRPLLQDIGLTYPQYLVMLTLWQNHPLAGKDIAERLNLSANAISPLLDRLEESGFVTRERDAVDRRVVHVALTDRGIALEREASRAQNAVVCHTELSDGELAHLRDELKALVDRMEPAPGEPSDEADKRRGRVSRPKTPVITAKRRRKHPVL